MGLRACNYYAARTRLVKRKSRSKNGRLPLITVEAVTLNFNLGSLEPRNLMKSCSRFFQTTQKIFEAFGRDVAAHRGELREGT